MSYILKRAKLQESFQRVCLALNNQLVQVNMVVFCTVLHYLKSVRVINKELHIVVVLLPWCWPCHGLSSLSCLVYVPVTVHSLSLHDATDQSRILWTSRHKRLGRSCHGNVGTQIHALFRSTRSSTLTTYKR